MSSLLANTHRRLALLASLLVLCWAGSGLLHPLMSNLQPRAPVQSPPVQTLALAGLRAPAALQDGGAPVQALRLLTLDGRLYYQARQAGSAEPRYWDARSGAVVELTARHAEALARHYLNSDEPLHYRYSLADFDAEYVFINRLLPAARVDSLRDDGLRLYLDLHSDRLGTLVDARKAAFGRLFQSVHSLRWLSDGLPRALLVSLLLVLVLAACLLGIGLWCSRPRRPGLARLHGHAGLLLALVAASFAISGGWHLWQRTLASPSPGVPAAQQALAALPVAPDAGWLAAGEQARRVELVWLDGRGVWRIEVQGAGGAVSQRWFAGDGQPLAADSGERRLQQRLAQHASGLGQPLDSGLQTAFDHDYGFVNKRLPVWRVRYGDAQHTSLYLDPLDGVLAARVTDSMRREGWVFAWLHKWEMFSPLGKPVKDAAQMTLAAALLLLTLSGLWLAWLRRRARAARQ